MVADYICTTSHVYTLQSLHRFNRCVKYPIFATLTYFTVAQLSFRSIPFRLFSFFFFDSYLSPFPSSLSLHQLIFSHLRQSVSNVSKDILFMTNGS